MEVGYVAYIDEDGDDNLKKVMPIHKNGASEWLVLSCALVQVHNDYLLDDWLSRSLKSINAFQRKDIHFRDLVDYKKDIVCREAAALPVRFFVVMSNKKNMQNYKNHILAGDRKSWLYWWMTRLLMERVTKFCGQWSRKYHDKPKSLEIIFSRRGDLKYNDLLDYFIKLWVQTENDRLFLRGEMDWSVIDLSEIYAVPHSERAGLQLADVVASSFFQSVTLSKGKCNSSFAKALKPRVRRCPSDNGGDRFVGFGVKPMPSIDMMGLTLPQREIFTFYGYKGDW